MRRVTVHFAPIHSKIYGRCRLRRNEGGVAMRSALGVFGPMPLKVARCSISEIARVDGGET